MTFQDYRVIGANLSGIVASTPRKRFVPSKVFPRPQMDLPVVYGVQPSYVQIAGLRVVDGRFFDGQENQEARPICVLGEGAKASLFGPTPAVGQYIKVDVRFQLPGERPLAKVPPDGELKILIISKPYLEPPIYE